MMLRAADVFAGCHGADAAAACAIFAPLIRFAALSAFASCAIFAVFACFAAVADDALSLTLSCPLLRHFLRAFADAAAFDFDRFSLSHTFSDHFDCFRFAALRHFRHYHSCRRLHYQ